VIFRLAGLEVGGWGGWSARLDPMLLFER
jgi:hypothetical protein